MNEVILRCIRLDLAAEYLIEGPYAVVPGAVDEEEDWLEPQIKLSQYRGNEGPIEARTLFVLADVLQPDTIRPLVRSLLWQRTADRERASKTRVEVLDAEVRYYALNGESEDVLVESISDLHTGLRAFPFRLEALDKRDYLFGSEASPDEITIELPQTAPYLRRVLFSGPSFTIRLIFLQGASPILDQLWERVWNALGQSLDEEGRVAAVEESYPVDPDAYVRQILTAPA